MLSTPNSRRIVSLLTAVLLCAPASAMAQVPPPPSGPAAPAPGPAPSASPAAGPELTEAQKLDRAKMLYGEAEDHAKKGEWIQAVPKYEEAYYLVPSKHGFAYKVGLSAWETKDCTKSEEYLKHFLTYADPNAKPEWNADAKRILGEISVAGCAKPDPTPAIVTTPTEDPTDEENPLGPSRSSERAAANEAAADDAEKKKASGLMIGGAILTAIGVAGVGLGVTGNILAGSAASKLQAAADPGDTGFPQGDYSSSSPDGPFELERSLKRNNTLTYIGYGVGGLALAAGIVMLVLDAKAKKKSSGNAQNRGPKLTAIGPTLGMRF